MAAEFLTVTREQLCQVPGRGHVDAHKNPMAPLYQAVREADVRLVFVPACNDPLDEALADLRPTVMLLCDGPGDSGPTAFDVPSLRRAFARASDCCLVTAWRFFEHYAWAAVSAASGRPLAILVETWPARETAWIEFIRAANPSLPILIARDEEGRA